MTDIMEEIMKHAYVSKDYSWEAVKKARAKYSRGN